MARQKEDDRRQCGGERGFAIVIVLVILMTLTVLAVGVITSTTTNSALTRNYEKSKQATNMSEIGIKVAYREFINSGFLKTTHTLNAAAPQTGNNLLVTSLNNYSIDSNDSLKWKKTVRENGHGDFVWEWDDSKSYLPMWVTDLPHGFRFRVFYTSSFAFVIECDGWYDTIHKRTRAKGEIETMFEFSYFSAQDMGNTAEEIRGKVHVNGDLFLRPDAGSTLKFNSSSVTATGFIIRSRDKWGRPDASKTVVSITKNAQDGTYVEMAPGSPPGSEGVAFDSFNPNWSSKTLGARAKWGGVVRDKVPFKSPPPIQNLDPGGYYDTNATLPFKITSATSNSAWCTQRSFTNQNEARLVTVKDINVGVMKDTIGWPPNGLIYCSFPVRLYNAATLGGKLMLASNSTIYTKGNFNTVNKQGATLMTKHRIYHLSQSWADSLSDQAFTLRKAVNDTINAALVDGAPTVDEYNWVDRDSDNRYDSSLITIYTPVSPKTAAGHSDPPNPLSPWANVEDLLEDWNYGSPKSIQYTLTKFGSVVHLEGAVMCTSLDNSDWTADKLCWIRAAAYDPPYRSYLYDPDLATPARQPPFTSLIGHITSWAPF